MRVGLHALGIGSGADPAVMESVARSAEAAGFATLWSGEHVVMVDRPDSPYPYASDGRIAVPSDADWLDPFVGLSYVAAVTSRIRLATGILLLPEHHPILVAKQAASLDVLSGGRFTLGVGIGWSSEEFGALGIPFRDRASRTREYIDVMRTLWQSDDSSFDGPTISFRNVRCYPKPVNDHRVPVVLGGNSDAALDRVAAIGDGWYGFNLSLKELPERLSFLRTRRDHYDRGGASMDIAVSVVDATPADLGDLEALGIDELVVVEAPPDGPGDAGRWVGDLAGRWKVTAS